ncbi:hypothetical protein DMUE_4664 [Dictyocoela muelleri]|nr:hypothetical protein DMUE_4664 [Dictyocoela muelleri]
MRNEARLSTQRALDRMVVRSMWRSDYLQFQLCSRVLIRPDVDNNEQTRRRGLYEHLNTKVYIVDSILQFNKVRLRPEDNIGDNFESIDIIRLHIVGDNKRVF